MTTNPIARLTGAKCLHRHGPIPSHPVDCAGGCKGTGRRYPWSVRKCWCKVNPSGVHGMCSFCQQKDIDIHGRNDHDTSPREHSNNCENCNGTGYLPLPDAELAMQVMGRAVMDNVSHAVFHAVLNVERSTDVGAVIHAMTQAACAALMEVQS